MRYLVFSCIHSRMCALAGVFLAHGISSQSLLRKRPEKTVTPSAI